MVVFKAIASSPDEIGCTLDSSCRKIFHGTRVLKGKDSLDGAVLSSNTNTFSNQSWSHKLIVIMSLRNVHLVVLEAHPSTFIGLGNTHSTATKRGCIRSPVCRCSSLQSTSICNQPAVTRLFLYRDRCGECNFFWTGVLHESPFIRPSKNLIERNVRIAATSVLSASKGVCNEHMGQRFELHVSYATLLTLRVNVQLPPNLTVTPTTTTWQQTMHERDLRPKYNNWQLWCVLGPKPQMPPPTPTERDHKLMVGNGGIFNRTFHSFCRRRQNK